MAQKTQWVLVGLVLLLAVTMVGCNTAEKRWLGTDSDSDHLSAALNGCHVFMKENFNPYEDFSDPALGSLAVEANLNRRVAYRRMFQDCMQERGYRLARVS